MSTQIFARKKASENLGFFLFPIALRSEFTY